MTLGKLNHVPNYTIMEFKLLTLWKKEPLKSKLGKVRCQRSWREMQSVRLPSRIWTGMRDSPTGRALAAEEEWLRRRTHESGSYNPLFPCESETVSTTKAILTNRASSYHLIGAPTNGWKHPGRNLTQTCISEEFQLRPKRSEAEAIALLQSYSIHRCYWCFFYAVCITSASKTSNTATYWF